MARLFKNIRGAVQPAVFFVPFTYYFILFAAALAIADYWIVTKELVTGSSFTDIFKLLVKTGFWFVLAIIVFALLSVLLSYIIFIVQKKKNKVSFSIRTGASVESTNQQTLQTVHISIAPVLKPFVGFIKLRLMYDGDNYSKKFVLAEESQRKIFTTRFAGDYTWELPAIREYHVDKLMIYFEDMFQFFSLTVSLPVKDRFYTQPLQKKVKDIQLSPRKTEETETRIEELKRIEGEFLNYKNFEDNDDVRRIVWKIYAKNKELVVRIPEVLDPYASHAYMYASFHSSFDIEGNDTAEIYFLNYYKTIVWSIYQQLGKQGFALRFIPDQQTGTAQTNDENQAVQYKIITSSWHNQKDLKAYANAKDASIVVLSSFCDADDLQTVMDTHGGSTVFVFVKLSRSLRGSYIGNLLSWIFVQQEKNEIELYKSKWNLSLLRPKIIQNEKKLEALLEKYSKTVVI